LQRRSGANRRLTGGLLDLIVVASGDGRHSPCLRAVRVYAPRFCYQDEYLPALFHQTAMPDEADQTTPASPPDFRERLLANVEGILTPIENRVAAAEYLLDPYATPTAMLPWLGSYLGRTLDPGWPEARQRRAIAAAGRQLRQRGTYRGVCLAVDIATDGAIGRGEVVLLETHRLRRTNATVLGIPMGGRNVLTQFGVPSGNSIVGDTLVLSSERAIEVLALLAPSLASGADAATVARFLDHPGRRHPAGPKRRIVAGCRHDRAAGRASGATPVRDRAGATALHHRPVAAARRRYVPRPACATGAPHTGSERDRARCGGARPRRVAAMTEVPA
jgi:phage tail-like protein